MPEMAGISASQNESVMACNCSKCGKVRDEKELTARMTGKGFSRRIRYYCTDTCLAAKIEQTELNRIRTKYQKCLRAQYINKHLSARK